MAIEVQSFSNYMCVHMYIHETERMCVESWIGFSEEMSWTVVCPACLLLASSQVQPHLLQHKYKYKAFPITYLSLFVCM